LASLPIIAEDLGVITPDVVALREEFGFPGMRILQFGFGSNTKKPGSAHNYVQNVVAYTRTHDNDTTLGWFHSVAGEARQGPPRRSNVNRNSVLSYLNSDGKEIHWDFIRGVWASVANTAIVPLQDLLGLGTEARMNLPNSTSGNWSWRYKPDALGREVAERLKKLTELYGRAKDVAEGVEVKS
jgi:4-alpha-glucanotransferase